MAKALKKLSSYWYTPEGEPEHNPTRFKIKPLNGEEQTEIMMLNTISGVGEDGKPLIQTSPRAIALAIKYGVIGWENFGDDEGDLEYSAINKKYIPFELRIELAGEIVTNSTLDADTKKK